MHIHTNIFMQTLFTVHVMQGPVSFSDMGIRAVNRLKVMQYRNETGLCMCVNQDTQYCQPQYLIAENPGCEQVEGDAV